MSWKDILHSSTPRLTVFLSLRYASHHAISKYVALLNILDTENFKKIQRLVKKEHRNKNISLEFWFMKSKIANISLG